MKTKLLKAVAHATGVHLHLARGRHIAVSYGRNPAMGDHWLPPEPRRLELPRARTFGMAVLPATFHL